MAHCSGCGAVLGWKKYRFQKMWRIPGYYCRECMLELGSDFDKHGRITAPTHGCKLCGVGYYFLKRGPGGGKYCSVCREAVAGGAVPASAPAAGQPAQPKNLPLVMMVFAGLGGTMMVLGLAFTMLSTGSDANVVNILFGATTTALGFVLLRKTLRSRSLLMGRPPVSPAEKP